jgi:hypothetical protein
MAGRWIKGHHLDTACSNHDEGAGGTSPLALVFVADISEELILPDQMDEQRYTQHKERTEKTLKKVVIFAAAIFMIIVVGAFFV